jgi:hypothetical protein
MEKLIYRPAVFTFCVALIAIYVLCLVQCVLGTTVLVLIVLDASFVVVAFNCILSLPFKIENCPFFRH